MNIGIDPISLNASKTIFNRVIMITTAILISWLLLMSIIITTERHQAFARCPNGTHKSPSGDCEPVVKSSTKLQDVLMALIEVPVVIVKTLHHHLLHPLKV